MAKELALYPGRGQTYYLSVKQSTITNFIYKTKAQLFSIFERLCLFFEHKKAYKMNLVCLNGSIILIGYAHKFYR